MQAPLCRWAGYTAWRFNPSTSTTRWVSPRVGDEFGEPGDVLAAVVRQRLEGPLDHHGPLRAFVALMGGGQAPSGSGRDGCAGHHNQDRAACPVTVVVHDSPNCGDRRSR